MFWESFHLVALSGKEYIAYSYRYRLFLESLKKFTSIVI